MAFETVNTETKPEVKPVVKSKCHPHPDPEKAASMQRAHDLKVAKFLAGGEF